MAPIKKPKPDGVKKISFNATDVTPARGVEEKMSWKEYKKMKEQVGIGMPKKLRKKKEPIANEEDSGPKKPMKLTNAQKERHDTGAGVIDPSTMRSKLQQEKMKMTKEKFERRIEATAKAEKRLVENAGFVAPDDEEDNVLTYSVRQRDIVEAVDLAAATKHFELKLPRFGPYHIDYTDNGRHLVIGGRKGHLAAIDWQTKHLHFEQNVMEKVSDVKFLHTENFIAVAQKNYTYVYDNLGTELHCLKTMYDTARLEFLPRHFLLVGGSRNSFLNYVDVSVGKQITSFATKCGTLDVMCQNPANAIIHTGHTNGTVSLWSPNSKEPLVKILAHLSAVKGIAVDDQGNYMATTGLDRKCRIWDVRMFRQLHAYSLPFGVSNVAISQKLDVACAVGNHVQVFRGMHNGTCKEPYLVHNCGGVVTDLRFVPWEDVLGIGHAGGFTSMLVPGAGDPNVDTLRSNPYETKSQRKEREIKQLLDKLQPELISLDPEDINKVNEGLLEVEEEERKKILYIRPMSVQYTPRHKMRSKKSGWKMEARKNIVKDKIRMERNMEKHAVEKEVFGEPEQAEQSKKKHILDRLK
ncbi:Protein CBR-WDR-46 [Caenorhabditis briggsae]|uniref:Protein CBR-WDR-46 n=1 Tax=Caenorhabditis briggsae TaxID=6238 RepID=A8WUR9_CAEBR|nr:Protein CBR-WDR-46 [Caenorhabditis briggsae]CAP24231.1 Protein CBR-WDR-46 [Caenorhabditis briggsae]